MKQDITQKGGGDYHTELKANCRKSSTTFTRDPIYEKCVKEFNEKWDNEQKLANELAGTGIVHTDKTNLEKRLNERYQDTDSTRNRDSIFGRMFSSQSPKAVHQKPERRGLEPGVKSTTTDAKLPKDHLSGFKGYIYINESQGDSIMFGFDEKTVKNSNSFNEYDKNIFNSLNDFNKNVLPVKNIGVMTNFLQNTNNLSASTADIVTSNHYGINNIIIHKIAIPKNEILGEVKSGIPEMQNAVNNIIDSNGVSSNEQQPKRGFFSRMFGTKKTPEKTTNDGDGKYVGGKRKTKKSKKSTKKSKKSTKKSKKSTKKSKKSTKKSKKSTKKTRKSRK